MPEPVAWSERVGVTPGTVTDVTPTAPIEWRNVRRRLAAGPSSAGTATGPSAAFTEIVREPTGVVIVSEVLP